MQLLIQPPHDHINIQIRSNLKESNFGTRQVELNITPSTIFIQSQQSLERLEKYLKKFPKKDQESETMMKYPNHKISIMQLKKVSEN